MTMFKYVSIDKQGRTQKGILEGESPLQVRQKLRDKGLNAIEVTTEENQSTNKDKTILSIFRMKKISIATLSLFTYQLSILLSVGLSIEAALQNISDQIENKELKYILLNIRSRILEGNSLSYAMNEYSYLFPTLYRMTIAAGEASGQLEKVTNRLAIYLDQQENVRQKIQQALIYPILLTIVSIVIILFLLSYAMPKITDAFVQSHQALPSITLFLLSTSHILKSYGIYIILIFFIVIMAFRQLLKIETFYYKAQVFLLKIPALNKALIMINTSRFIRTLSVLLTANVPLLESMRIANTVIRLLPLQKAVSESMINIGEGISIHQALLQSGYFSKLVIQLIASGEASGKLDVMLDKVSFYQERVVTGWITTALSLFEPLMILLMGGIVLFIVLAVLLPIFQMNQFLG